MSNIENSPTDQSTTSNYENPFQNRIPENAKLEYSAKPKEFDTEAIVSKQRIAQGLGLVQKNFAETTVNKKLMMNKELTREISNFFGYRGPSKYDIASERKEAREME